MNILVCGGAGYIGSHAVLDLIRRGHKASVIDSLENGRRHAIAEEAQFYQADLRDYVSVSEIFASEKFDAVMDFAAYSLVGESVADPLKYYENNVFGTMNLLKAMRDSGVKYLVFSSTASVYGLPETFPIGVDAETRPINPYGETKLAVEKMLRWCDEAYGIKSACLRYFNVAGADESGLIGEDHRPETHIIPNIITAAMNGTCFKLFGDDYDTPDGTCIRDYIHVTDVIDAHILALESIMKTGESVAYNLGSQSGYSNLEIINAVKRVTELDVKYEIAPRRPGDPDVLVASFEKINNELGWKPKFGLEEIISSAYEWHKRRL